MAPLGPGGSSSRKATSRIAIQPVALAITAMPIDLAGPLVATERTGTRIASTARTASRTSMTVKACQAVTLSATSVKGLSCNVAPSSAVGRFGAYQGRNSATSSRTPPRPAIGSARRIGLGRGLRGFEGVAQEHRDRHRADAAGHRGDQRRALDGGRELYVARQLLRRAV